MFIVGLTGGSGTGKSTVAKIFEGCGLPVIDADEVYAGLVGAGQPCLLAVSQAFEGVLREDGGLDRKALAEQVFSDPEKLALLSEITHPFVTREIERRIALLEKAEAKIAVVDAPALRESGFEKMCDMIVAVAAPEAERIRRIMTRDGISQGSAYARVSAQKQDGFYTQGALVIENDKGLNDLATKTCDAVGVIIKRWEALNEEKANG